MQQGKGDASGMFGGGSSGAVFGASVLEFHYKLNYNFGGSILFKLFSISISS